MEKAGSILSIIGVAIGVSIARNYFHDSGVWVTILAAAIGAGVIGGLTQLAIEIVNKIKTKKSKFDKESNEIILQEDNSTKSEIASTIELTDHESGKPIINKPFYYGFGGWLYLVSIGQLYTLYIALTTIFETDLPLLDTPEWDLLTDPNSEVYSPIWEPFIYIEIIGCSLFIILLALVGYLTIRLSRFYKRVQISLYLFNIVYSIVVLLLMFSINSYYDDQIFISTDYSKIIVQTITASIIWIPYFLVSKRVKNTFNR